MQVLYTKLMGKIIAFLLLIGAIFGGLYLYKNYGGLYNANAPAKTDIVSLIEKSMSPESLKPGENKTQFPLKVPDGYTVSIYAKDLGNPRDLTLDPNGVVIASLMGQGRVVALLGGTAETVVDGLVKPHGLVFNGNKLYVAETNEVVVYDYDTRLYKGLNKKKIIDLPKGDRHFTRSLLIKDGKLYISIGSHCDACVESDPRYASVWSANLDGSDFKLYASGLRNSVFITLNPFTNEIWGTEMGRDFLGDDLPPEEINIIKPGHYGWPYCYGDKVVDNSMNPGGTKFDCSKTTPPHIKFQAHSAPLGLAFLGDDLLVSFHGSWNRTVPTGYKVVKFKLDKNGNSLGGPEDFLTGWKDDGAALGRPVDILVKGAEIYLSDDKAGVVYLVKPI